MEHHLTPADIMALPAKLKTLHHELLGNEWNWIEEPHDADWIQESWALPADYFTTGPGSIEDLVMLEGNGLSIWFVNARLLMFDTGLLWKNYQSGGTAQERFNETAQALASLLGVTNMFAVPDLPSISLLDEAKDVQLKDFRKKLQESKVRWMEIR